MNLFEYHQPTTDYSKRFADIQRAKSDYNTYAKKYMGDVQFNHNDVPETNTVELEDKNGRKITMEDGTPITGEFPVYNTSLYAAKQHVFPQGIIQKEDSNGNLLYDTTGFPLLMDDGGDISKDELFKYTSGLGKHVDVDATTGNIYSGEKDYEEVPPQSLEIKDDQGNITSIVTATRLCFKLRKYKNSGESLDVVAEEMWKDIEPTITRVDNSKFSVQDDTSTKRYKDKSNRKGNTNNYTYKGITYHRPFDRISEMFLMMDWILVKSSYGQGNCCSTAPTMDFCAAIPAGAYKGRNNQNKGSQVALGRVDFNNNLDITLIKEGAFVGAGFSGVNFGAVKKIETGAIDTGYGGNTYEYTFNKDLEELGPNSICDSLLKSIRFIGCNPDADKCINPAKTDSLTDIYLSDEFTKFSMSIFSSTTIKGGNAGKIKELTLHVNFGSAAAVHVLETVKQEDSPFNSLSSYIGGLKNIDIMNIPTSLNITRDAKGEYFRNNKRLTAGQMLKIMSGNSNAIPNTP